LEPRAVSAPSKRKSKRLKRGTSNANHPIQRRR
jgi:hypothetical protein